MFMSVRLVNKYIYFFYLLAPLVRTTTLDFVHSLQECGQVLSEITPQGFSAVFERFRGILHEGEIDKRVQYTVEKLFEARRKKFTDYPGVLPELDLVEEDDQITHEIDLLEEDVKGEEGLNIFKAKEPEVGGVTNILA
eukprot:GHVU01026434.1.p2 GENE.GHVU01026434.1~~GHVU01026434.1.p2  ORF type:complete len:138 (+),score=26.05 GHVU01026434.1:412-825(+)